MEGNTGNAYFDGAKLLSILTVSILADITADTIFSIILKGIGIIGGTFYALNQIKNYRNDKKNNKLLK